mgnify:CR=1 FL=1
MAHFAKIGMNGKVIQVLTMDNEEMKDDQGNEIEAKGQEWLERHNNWPAQMWIQTSYNTYKNKHASGDDTKAFRGNYAGIGYEWDEDNNIFWSKKPFASWVKDTSTASWISPIGDAPELTEEQIADKKVYTWNETEQRWDLTDSSA